MTRSIVLAAGFFALAVTPTLASEGGGEGAAQRGIEIAEATANFEDPPPEQKVAQPRRNPVQPRYTPMTPGLMPMTIIEQDTNDSSTGLIVPLLLLAIVAAAAAN